MPTDRKIQQVSEIKERLERCVIAVSTTTTGLDANDMNDLRRRLRERNVEYRIVKNTLTYIAAEEASKPQLREVVQGPTGLAFGYDDPRLAAQTLEEFIRATRSPLAIQGALLNTRTLTPEEVHTLATLPSQDELLSRVLGQMQYPIARLVGQMQAPIVGLVNTLNATIGGLGNVLQQRIQQLEGESD
jgi:large subunit ribosomal protein L10